jgi:DNA mismatch repair ATPase MutS
MKQIELTPSMKQFIEIQAKKPKAIVFFGVGNDYVTWQETARMASEILGRELRVSDEVSWIDGKPFIECSFPMCMANSMIDKFVHTGKSVCLCEQLENQRTKSKFQVAIEELRSSSAKKC